MFVFFPPFQVPIKTTVLLFSTHSPLRPRLTPSGEILSMVTFALSFTSSFTMPTHRSRLCITWRKALAWTYEHEYGLLVFDESNPMYVSMLMQRMSCACYGLICPCRCSWVCTTHRHVPMMHFRIRETQWISYSSFDIPLDPSNEILYNDDRVCIRCHFFMWPPHHSQLCITIHPWCQNMHIFSNVKGTKKSSKLWTFWKFKNHPWWYLNHV